jgi:hypothetical protein
MDPKKSVVHQKIPPKARLTNANLLDTLKAKGSGDSHKLQVQKK